MKINKVLRLVPLSAIISNLAYAYYDTSKPADSPKDLLQLSLINILIIALVFFVFLPASWFSLNYLILNCFEQYLSFTVVKSAILLSSLNIILLLISVALLVRFKNKISEKREAAVSAGSSNKSFAAKLFLGLCKALANNLNIKG